MVTIRVPATSANLGPGYDTFGIALSTYLTVTILISSIDEISINGHESDISNRPEENLILKAVENVYSKTGFKIPPLKIIINNDIPVSKGLGSSAAAIVAGTFAANHLLGDNYSIKVLTEWAVEMEGHADNIVPAIFGGFTTVMMVNQEVLHQKVNIPSGVGIVVAVPDFILPTQKARTVIPVSITIENTVLNIQRAGFLLASLYNNDLSHVGLAMDDSISQPVRKQFIPGFDLVLSKAKEAGAIGVAMSGAGPSILAITNGQDESVGIAMKQAFSQHSVNCSIMYLKPDTLGVTVLA